mgnify:CR=1 FL=1
MKNIIFLGLLAFSLSTNINAQSSDRDLIIQTIKGFAHAGDSNDAKKLGTYLDENYRIVMNRLFGSTAVAVMNRNTYLEKIESKEFGGDKRKVKVESVTLNGTTASAKVILNGKKMNSVSLLTLLKDDSNQWKLVSDIPIIK